MITLHDQEYRLNASCTRIKTNECEWGIALLTMAMEGDWQAYDSELLSYDYGYNGIESLAARQLNPASYRLLDPGIGRWYQIDPAAESFYGLSLYVSMGNNPVVMVDPDGDFIFTAAALIAAPFTAGATLSLLPYTIGADLGMWQGGSLANGTMNPFKWDYGSGKTWGYMAGGTIVSAASGGVANAITTSGMVGANTAALVSGSFINSAGTALYTGGQTDVSVSFGFGSYNFTTGEFGYLGKRGNSSLENIGFGLGVIANISDLLAGFNPGKVELQTENLSEKGNLDLVGHSQLNSNGNVLIDFGPTGNWKRFEPGTNSWLEGKLINDLFPNNNFNTINIKGINLSRLNRISSRMNSNPRFYQVLIRSCSSTVSRALTLSGVPAIGIHPYILNTQMYLRSLGVRPTLFSYYLNN